MILIIIKIIICVVQHLLELMRCDTYLFAAELKINVYTNVLELKKFLKNLLKCYEFKIFKNKLLFVFVLNCRYQKYNMYLIEIFIYQNLFNP